MVHPYKRVLHKHYNEFGRSISTPMETSIVGGKGCKQEMLVRI